MNYINEVKKFHEVFGHPINDNKDVIDLKTRQLRLKLLFEELQELAVAMDVQETFKALCLTANYGIDGNNVNKVEELDALCDIQYVLSGAILALGHHKNFDDAFANVQESNMSKGCKDLKEAELTQQFYLDKGIESYVVEKDNMFIVLRKEDNKVLKNINYIKTDLEKYV